MKLYILALIRTITGEYIPALEAFNLVVYAATEVRAGGS